MQHRYCFNWLLALAVCLTQGLLAQDNPQNGDSGTPGIVNLTVDPQSFELFVPLGQTTASTLTIANSGSTDLRWTIVEEDLILRLPDGTRLPLRFKTQGFSDTPAGYDGPPLTLQKGEADTRRGPLVTQGIGGPDAFGYSFIDSDEPGGPVFAWQDIRNTGISVNLGDDDFVEVPLPFSFPFYGVDQRSVKISSNGYVTFGSSGQEPTNAPIPLPALPNNVIAPFWDDLDPSSGSSRVSFRFDTAAREFVIQYTNLRPFFGSGDYTFQVILRGNGEILFQYLSMQGTLNLATVGIENGDGSTGLQAAFNTSYVRDSLAVVFRPGCAWLDVTPISGVLQPGAEQAVALDVQSATLPAGRYECQLLVNSSSAGDSPVVVPVRLTVGPPDISITPPGKDFGDVVLNTSLSQSFAVSNQGELDLVVSSAVLSGPSAGQFAIRSGGTGFTVPAGQSGELLVDYLPTSEGLHSATLTVNSNDPDEAAFAIALSGNGIAPDIAVSPASHSFGDVRINTAASQTFVITNEGLAPLFVSETALLNVTNGDFVITSGGGSFQLLPGASRTLQVRFQPLTTGIKSATLQFTSNDPDEGTLIVPLSGRGVVPDIAVTPTAHDFGVVFLGESASQNFLVRNEGSQTLTVSSLSLFGSNGGEFSIVSGGGAFTLGPGGSRSLVVAFTPQTLGSKNATVQIVSNDPDETILNVALSGLARGIPDIAASPTSLEFGEVRLDTSANSSLVISNAGTEDLIVSNMVLLGNASGEFAIANGIGAFQLPPGGALEVVIAFNPLSTGDKTAVLQFTSNDPDQDTLTVALSGRGVIPDIALDTLVFDFGEVLLGTAPTRAFVVSNEGSGDLTVTAVTLSGENGGEFALVDEAAPFALPPGATREVVIRFAPTTAGAKTALLRFESDDPDEGLLEVSLSGQAVTPDIALDVDSVGFGFVQIGNAIDRNLQLRNEGSADLTVSQILLLGPNAAEFALSDSGDFLLVPGEIRQVTVQFTPLLAGTKFATLQVDSDDPDETPLVIPLTGTAVLEPVQDIAVAPPTGDFGDLPVKETLTQTFAIVNQGTADLLVASTALLGPDTAQFSLSGARDSLVLAPGDTHSVSITFTPDSVSSFSATLRLINDDPDEDTLDVALFGNGILAPNIVTAGALDFGRVSPGDSAFQSLAVVNSGELNLIVASAVIAGDNPEDFTVQGGGEIFLVAPGDTQLIALRFKPAQAGVKTASLRIVSNDPTDNPVEVILRGEAVVPDIAISPDTLSFGKVPVDSLGFQTLLVINQSTATDSLIVSDVRLSGGQAGEFTLLSGTTPFILAPGDTHSIRLSFRPGDAGIRADTLRITSNDPDQKLLTVPLSGEGFFELPHEFLFLSADDVSFNNFILTEGEVFANNDITFRDGAPSTHVGNLFAVDDIEIRRDNTIFGNATAGDEVENRGVVTGTITPNAPLQPRSLPSLAYRATGASFTVPGGDTLALDPGTYNSVNVEGVLVLRAGKYFLSQLVLSSLSRLIIDVSGGRVIVNVVDDLSFKRSMQTAVVPLGEAGSDRIRFNTLQSADLDIGPASQVIGSIIAPNAEVNLERNSLFRGGIAADKIRVHPSVVALHHYAAFSLAKVLAEGGRGDLNNGEALPEKFELSHNYPNPFNPSTLIDFSVAHQPTKVQLKIYDITGRLVKTLVNSIREPGFYTMEWDGRSERGDKVAAGFYLYRMEAGDFVDTKKMILVK